MRIKWSSEAALEIAAQLERAEWSLEDSRTWIAMIRTALSEANPDGENQALSKAAERFERDAVSINRFTDLLNDTLSGVKQADRIMTDAERENARRGDNMEEGTWYENRRETSSFGKIDWAVVHTTPMPYFRINRVPLPEWLEELTANPQIFTLIR